MPQARCYASQKSPDTWAGDFMKVAVRSIGAIAAGGGLAFLLFEVLRWAPCLSPLPTIGPDGLIRNDTLQPACFDLMQMNQHSEVVTIFWLAGLVAISVGAAMSRTRWALVAALVALAATPALHSGYFLLPWDSADLMPGFGTGTGLLIAVAGAILAFAPARSTPAVPRAASSPVVAAA